MLVNARLAARAGALVLPLALLGGLAGCGDEADPRPVRLEVTAPADATVVREDTVEIRGRVTPPGARVLVLGRRATVTGGEFRALVPLSPGSNVVDLSGSAPGAAPGWAAVRVAREILVTVPDVAGLRRDDAVERLEELGLEASSEDADGLLDRLIGGELFVCESSPAVGADVSRGTVVELTVSRTC